MLVSILPPGARLLTKLLRNLLQAVGVLARLSISLELKFLKWDVSTRQFSEKKVSPYKWAISFSFLYFLIFPPFMYASVSNSVRKPGRLFSKDVFSLSNVSNNGY